MNNSGYLEHHGIKGQKWGINRRKRQLASYQVSDKREKRAETVARKRAERMMGEVSGEKEPQVRKLAASTPQQAKPEKKKATASSHIEKHSSVKLKHMYSK